MLWDLLRIASTSYSLDDRKISKLRAADNDGFWETCNFSYLSTKTYVVTPHLNHLSDSVRTVSWGSSNEGSKHWCFLRVSLSGALKSLSRALISSMVLLWFCWTEINFYSLYPRQWSNIKEFRCRLKFSG